MSKEMQQSAETAVKGTFTFNGQLANGKSLTIQGYLLDGEHTSKLIDEAHSIIDRQRACSEIPKLEAEVDVLFMRLRQHKEALEGMVAQMDRLKNDGALSSTAKKKLMAGSAELTQIDNLRKTIGQIQEEIDKGLAAIETAKKTASAPG